jgi:fatty acid/phospholipid biosynthesis enzyme
MVSKGHPIPKEFVDYRDGNTTNIPSQEVQGVAQAVNRILKERVNSMKNKIAALPASCDISGISHSFDIIDKARMDNVRALSELNGI